MIFLDLPLPNGQGLCARRTTGGTGQRMDEGTLSLL